MNNASARVILGDRTVGTAWRFHDRCALTAAHCLVDTNRLQQLPATVSVKFPGVKPLQARARVKEGLDAALLEFVEPVPAGIPMIDLAKPPPGPMLSQYRWHGIAYPLVSDSDQMIMSGVISGYVPVRGGQALQISFDHIVNRRTANGQTLLSYASGAAVTYQQRAIGLVRASLEETQIGHAVPIDQVADAFPEVRERLRDYPVSTGGARWREIDRKDQWTEVAAAIAMPEWKTLVLPGEAGQGHKTFVERVESFLAGPPQRGRYIDVRWPDVSWNPQDFVAAISVALDEQDDPDETRLASRLRDEASRAKLVVVHEILDPEKHRDDLDTVVEYYQEVLPRIRGTGDAAGYGVLWVQPIEWAGANRKSMALDLIAKIARRDPTAVEVLRELAPLTETDLKAFNAPPSVMQEWSQRPTTREAFRLLKDSTRRRSHGPGPIPPLPR